MQHREAKRIRHWKQRFEPEAQFIWIKPFTWQGEPITVGGIIPAALAGNKVRLKRFWDSRAIGLAEFEQAPVKAEPVKAEPVKAEPVKAEPKRVTDEDIDDIGNRVVEPKLVSNPNALLIKVGRRWKIKGQECSYPSKKEALAANRQ